MLLAVMLFTDVTVYEPSPRDQGTFYLLVEGVFPRFLGPKPPGTVQKMVKLTLS